MADGIGAVDTSSYPRPQPPPNPLDQILKVGQVANTLGDIEVGRGNQQAIQPDGTIDRNVLAQYLKGSVAGSMKAPEALNAIEKLRQAGHSADLTAIQSQLAQVKYVGALTGPLADRNAVSQDELIDVAGKAINNANKLDVKGVIPHVAQGLQETVNMTPQQRAQWVKNHFLQSQEASRQLEAVLPRTVDIDDGANLTRQDAGNQLNPTTFTAVKQNPPGQETVDDRQTLPNGKPNPNYSGKMALGAGGSGPPQITNTGIAGQPSAPVRQFTEGSTVVGREPTVNAQTGQPFTTQTPQAAAANGPTSSRGPIPMALPAGAVTPLTASGESYAKDLTDSKNYRERMNPLAQAIPLLEKLGKTGVGPTQETVQHLKSAAQTLGLPGLNAETITDYAKAKKYLAQNAATVAPPGTNIPSVLNAMEANPNMGQPQQAAVDLSKMLYGLGRLRQASVLAFQKTGLPPSQYNDWASRWSPQQDIRGYTADLMTPEQRKDLLSKVKPGSKQAERISQSYRTAKDLDLIGDVDRPETK